MRLQQSLKKSWDCKDQYLQQVINNVIGWADWGILRSAQFEWKAHAFNDTVYIDGGSLEKMHTYPAYINVIIQQRRFWKSVCRFSCQIKPNSSNLSVPFVESMLSYDTDISVANNGYRSNKAVKEMDMLAI